MANPPDFQDIINKLIDQNNALMEAIKLNNRDVESETATPTQNNKVIGVQFDKFDESSERWDSFIDRFIAYMDVQNIPNEKRGKVLILSISPRLFTLLKSLLAPVSPAEKSFDELKEVLCTHLNPKPLIIPSRHAFLNRKQHEGESVSTFIAELRTLAVPCCYSTEMLN